MTLVRSPIGREWELAIWADGTEGEHLIEQFRQGAQRTMNRIADSNGLIFGEVRIVEKKPGEDRVPPVPKNIQGPNVRLIVAEATCVGIKA